MDSTSDKTMLVKRIPIILPQVTPRREVRKYCSLSLRCTKLLRDSVESMGLSVRAHDKILRVSRTIADIDGATAITEAHLSEAINDRSLDSDLWT